jgi:TP901 family phage tail tape measure protein
MADDRSMSLGTVFTAKAGPLIAAIRKVREEMEKLNAVMKGQATAAGGGTRQQAQATRQQSALVRTAKELKREIQDGAKFNTTYAQSLKNMVRENGASTASMKHAIAYHQKLRKTMLNQASAMNAAGQAGTAWMNTVNVNTLRQQALTGAMKQTSQGFVANVQAMAKTTSQAMGLRGVIQGLSNQFQLLGGAMKVSAAYMAAGSVFYQIAAGVKAGVKEIIDYDQALKNLSAITGATGKELDAMGDKIKDVASRTKFSTVEVAEGMVLLGQSGFSAEEAIQAMDAVANLATGTLTDMKFTTDLLTTTIRAFNLNAFEATKVADVMANAINKSKLTVDKLRIAFNYVGPAAHATGTSLEEVSAAMMVLANSGLRASTIGTGLRQILSRLAAPSDKLRESFQEHGIQMEDLNIRTHGFAGVLKNLHRVFVDSKTGIIDSAKAFELFGLRGANAILALTRSITTGEYKTALDYVYEVGTAAAMADKQIEGLALQFKNLADRAKLLAVELGALGIKDILSWFVQGLRGVVEGIKSFTGTESGSFIARLTIMNAAAFGLAVTLGLLGKALVFVAKTLGVLDCECWLVLLE